MSIASHIKATMTLLVIGLNLTFWCIPLGVLAMAKWLLPGRAALFEAGLDEIYRLALSIDDAWLRGVVGVTWNRPRLGIERDQNVIVLSNHSTWADILLIQSVVVRQGPILKFLTKRELIFIPLFGLICWAFDFPILRRSATTGVRDSDRRRRDFDAIRDACMILRQRPAALVNFAEGTRFSEAKRRQRSGSYVHLLEPKVGGFSAVLDALQGTKLCVVDLTVIYPEPPAFWRFLAGEPSHVEIEAAVFDGKEIPRDRAGRALWLADRWSIKDLCIERSRSRSTAESRSSANRRLA